MASSKPAMGVRPTWLRPEYQGRVGGRVRVAWGISGAEGLTVCLGGIFKVIYVPIS